jgi:hypothetical protein
VIRRTSLTNYAAFMREPDPEGRRRAAKEIWHENGIAVIFDGDCASIDWMLIEAVANRLYGKRTGGRANGSR